MTSNSLLTGFKFVPMKIIKFRNIRAEISAQLSKLSQEGFRQIFDHIDQLTIKKGVDKMGIDKFINQCAYFAAGSGAISGSGGLLTMIVGVPVDFINLITQQFRVTMAIMYYYRGSFEVTFEEFFSIVATSLKVEAGLAITKNMMEEVAQKILIKAGAGAAERLVPVAGAVIGGTANFIFIKRLANSVKNIHLKQQTVQIASK
jgi:hypothetical protein